MTDRAQQAEPVGEGKITEVFAYSRAITAAEAGDLHAYMFARYGA